MPERPGPAPDLLAEADLRDAARALLRMPLLTADRNPDELALVRRHRDELARVLADGLGYRLVVEPGLARLFKTGLGRDARRPLRRRNDVPFTPRRYALLALILAALTQARRQLMVDELVAAVRSAAVDAGVDVDLDAITDRRALHSALVALIDLGVLSERDGDLEHWVERRTESLLDVHRDRLAVLLSAPVAGCEGPDDLLAVVAVPSAAGGARVGVRRRLAEQPVLSTEDLTDEQREWWRRNREREREWFRRWLGLDLELRAEGAIAIDPGGELTDRPFPSSGSARHFALLLVGELVEELRTVRGGELHGVAWEHVAQSTARRAADRVFSTWRRGLRKEHRDHPDVVFEEAVDVLVEAGLVRKDPDGLLVHAAAARYAPRPELLAAGPSGERSLFEEDEA
ncbi:TIGR02678 family protein [Nocardioides sp. YIM 152315]|uniref:TIGR02678 family protein n=1 Tax=Nocardioides sp. YIM 152315 TaxID=3031760 RepID=UPI0023DC5451|nr:TIGR02678 family protein [Nocardioides sp. YIM 152315]MDF1604061.1 TIGR02678 family protein [Nocardioides sp. YIM 152315]